LSDKAISEILGLSTAALRKTFPTELASAHEAIAEVAQTLYETALGGNVAAMKFYLECRASWIPKHAEAEIASKASPLIVKLATPESNDAP